jgi:aminoglycoside 3-N-acetyltransferase
MVNAFRELGLESGDSFIVHSSFRSLGPVDGGPEAVIDALVEAVSPGGNVIFPTFNYTANIAEPYFDPAVVPCRTGIIPELSRKRPDAVRSLHPTHSVTVIGPDAAELTRDHMAFRTVGLGSPIDQLAKMGGKVLLLGVGHTSNTTVHLGEEYAGVPKEGWFEVPTCANVLMPDGSIYAHLVDTSTSCSRGFGRVEPVLRKYGEIADGRAGNAALQLMLGMDVVKRVVEIIGAQPDALLCDQLDCRPCTGARTNLRC